MKSSFCALLLICFSISIGLSTSNPWEIENLTKDQIIELQDIQFEMDKAVLTKESKESLKELKDFLKKNKSVIIELRGHTNSIPPHEYCDELSSQRANAVKDYLINKGIKADRLEANGYGKRVPKSFSVSGRELNQRVDVKIISL